VAFDFNGTTDRVDYTNVATLYNSALTISAWIYGDSFATNSHYIFTTHTASNTALGVTAWIATDGSVGFGINGSTPLQRNSAVSTVTTGVWTHVCVTHDGSTTAANCKIYKNGTETSYGTTTNGATPTSDASSTWSVGGRVYDDARNFDGRIAHFGVWTRALGAAAIAQIGAGQSPLLPQFATQRIFAPTLTRVAFDPQSGQAGTLDGTSVIESPRIFMPKRTRSVYVPDSSGQPARKRMGGVGFAYGGYQPGSGMMRW